MTSMNDSEFPSSPQNDESDEEEQDSIKQEEDEEDESPQSNVASILARLQSSGALIKTPKQEYRCFPCDNDFSNWQDLEKHIITHVSLPSVVLDKLPSDEEDLPPSGDENWSDEDEDQSPPKTNMAQTPQKIDISQILKKTGLSLKKTPSENNSSSSDSALNKLSGLGFTIKKNITPIKKEKPDNEENDNVMQKLGKLGGIKLKLKSDGNNTNSFKVVNGLKDFKASDDEDDGSANEDEYKEDQDFDEDMDKSGENDGSEGEQDSDDQQNNRKQSGNSDLETLKRKIPNLHAAIQGKVITPKKEPPSTPLKVTPIKIQKDDVLQVKPVNSRPVLKQTPKRGVIVPIASKETQQLNETATLRRPSQASTPDTPRRPSQTPTPDTPRRPSQTPTPDSSRRLSQTNTPERAQLNDRNENVVVKQEPQATSGDTQNNIPLFSGPIKSERSTPPLSERTTPILAHVKPEPEVSSTSSTQPLFSYQNSHSANTSTAITSHTNTLLPVTKTEDTGVTVIEINGDSNDEDDDCCVVSTTPAPDVKPIVPKVEKPTTLPPPYSATPSYTKPQTLYNTAPASSSRSLSTAPSTEKQHNFNWNAPDSKPPLDFLEKSTDDIFESLLSSSTKKENMSLSEASEYISLDTLGPQHSCDVCNTRFTDVSLLEEHIRMTGHSKSIVARTSSLMPYDPSSSNLLLSSLLPVKQIAEQVGKLSTTSNSGAGFTHQQNVMINIQAYPGAGGVMVPPQYNSYNSGQGTHGNYPQTSGNMYGTQPMTMPNQYPGTNFMPPGYGQYQPPMSKPGYPGPMPHNSFSMSSPQYSAASPLQSMQQAVYGQSMMNPTGSMGPPGSSPSHSYASTSSPGGLKQTSSGIKIQNVQTFPPGQMPGQTQPGQQMPSGAELGIGQMAPPSQPITGQVQGGTPIRMAAGANISGIRPRMPSVRGQRPTIRPGIQVHGQVRGAKMGGPRMPLKRPGAMAGGPGQKRRSDMLLPGKHDNEDCQVMALQKQREGLPLIQSVQGAKDKLNLGSQISITKKPVNKEANAMANVLASRGISVKQKQKSRSPTPERPLPHIPNLGAGMSIKHTSRSSKFSIPEAKVGGGMYSCKICKKMFMNHNSLQVHISNAHPQSKIPVFKCDECPASYPKSLQLQHHKRVFHNVTGPNRELGLPVVDLSQEDNLKRLSSLGIYSFIPLANREQANGCFGIPVISVHNMQNGLTSGLQALGADGLLSLGPLKPLPNS